MFNRSISRELSLLSLGLINDNESTNLTDFEIEEIIDSAMDCLTNYCKSELDECEKSLEVASQNLLESELCDIDNSFLEKIREELKSSLVNLEVVINNLSHSLEYPKLIALSDQATIRNDINKRISLITHNFSKIDNHINEVMEGWRFKRLPRLDRDILRLAFIDINYFDTPISVACNEAVNLANKYSDTQGRKMINGVLRRLQQVKIS